MKYWKVTARTSVWATHYVKAKDLTEAEDIFWNNEDTLGWSDATYDTAEITEVKQFDENWDGVNFDVDEEIDKIKEQ